ncbi:methionine--tRNA ligase [Terrihabitans sp. B22-R8]|uniref:methionine--tRNA ligase n=1 Tax=Terrihabitans sp. B22-R8 TaxID=3425128 RepID=UPI00403CE546
MSQHTPFYITTAIAYPNGAPHIGHAYEAIATDVISRFHRLDGHDVFFMTGADEHGIKMQQTADKAGITPAELVARNVPQFQKMAEHLNLSNDRYIRTTELAHHKASQAIWNKMVEKGDIYLGTYSGWYSVRDEAFYAETETVLQEGGTRLGPQGTPVEWVEENSYFFRLSDYQDRLLTFYDENSKFIGPDARRNEVVSFVRGGLQDLSISRTNFDWGIKVPGAEDHIMYVWVDALTNYLTGVGFPDEQSEMFRRYWPASAHIIGKDIIRFHAVYWPAFLMSAELELPKRVFAHGFLFNKGEKMSKSVGNVIDPFTITDTYGVDQVRYFFLREVPFGQDGNYSHEAIVQRINADLANDLGNLAQRSLSMIGKNSEGRVPKWSTFTEADRTLLTAADRLIDECRQAIDDFALHTMLAAIWRVVGDANRYFASEEPWKLRKTDPERMATVLYVTAETLRTLAILIQPVMPTAAARLLDALNVPSDQRSFVDLGEQGRLVPGETLPAPAPIFPRYVEPDEGAVV